MKFSRKGAKTQRGIRVGSGVVVAGFVGFDTMKWPVGFGRQKQQ
jgi:hypothetical protein